jgi:polyvinyl alcohol dehydrogenase (cytochrome)
LVAVFAAACAGSATAGEGTKEKGTRWRQLGYDLSSTFHNPESLLTPKRAAALETAWEYEAPQSVNGAPAVAGGRVYVLSGDALVALDAESGTEIWKRDDIGGSSSPTIAGGVVFALGGDPTLWAVDADTGEDVWSVLADDQEFASGFSSPVVTKQAVIVGLSSIEEVAAEANATYRGGVAAFDRKTGDELWRYRTAEPPYNGVGVWSSVSVDAAAGTVYATTGNNYTEEAGPTSDAIVALDLETGEARWVTQVSEGDVFTVRTARSQDSDFGTNPILFEAEIGGEPRKLVGAGQKSGFYWALDRETGEIVWQREVSDGSALIGGVFNNGAYDGKRILVAGNNGPPGPGPADQNRPRNHEVGTSILMALDPATGEIVWQQPLDNYVWAPITLADGVGFVAVDRELRAFATKTGEELFRLETVGTISSAPVVAGDRIYFGSGLGYFPPTKAGRTVYALEG